jgi:hypothetical protein
MKAERYQTQKECEEVLIRYLGISWVIIPARLFLVCVFQKFNLTVYQAVKLQIVRLGIPPKALKRR